MKLTTRTICYCKALVMALGVLTSVAPNDAFALAMHAPSVTPSANYVDYGLAFPEVGWLYLEDEGTPQGFGSSVLIDEHWVLTSARGVLANDLDQSSVFDSIRVGFWRKYWRRPRRKHVCIGGVHQPNLRWA